MMEQSSFSLFENIVTWVGVSFLIVYLAILLRASIEMECKSKFYRWEQERKDKEEKQR